MNDLTSYRQSACATQQVAAGHANSTTTEIYDMGSSNLDRDASHRLASYVMGIAG